MEFPAWDPVLIDIPWGLPIDIRWYGLMYLVGFFAAYQILQRLSRNGFFPATPTAVSDLITFAVLGVMIGGRTGYALFYDHELLNPLRFVQVWSGGLSFHGGLVGVCVAFWLFSRKHQVSGLRVADSCALAGTPGIFAVRIANFINGELYGRRLDAHATWADRFAMRFPTDPEGTRYLHLSNAWTMRDRELCIQVAFHHRTWDSVRPSLSEVDNTGAKIDWDNLHRFFDWDTAKANVAFRYPSQLFEACGEGLTVGLLMLVVYLLTRKRPLAPGAYGGLFLVGYAVVRFYLEYFRQPDAQFQTPDNPLGTVLWGFTMGQVLCAVMGLAGIGLLYVSKRAQAIPAKVVS